MSPMNSAALQAQMDLQADSDLWNNSYLFRRTEGFQLQDTSVIISHSRRWVIHHQKK